MLVEETQGAILSCTLKCTEFSMDTVDKILNIIVNLISSGKSNFKSGEQKLSQLSKQNCNLENVDISTEELKKFKKELKRTGVDFAVMRDKTTNEYKVFFKGKDIETINFCLNNYAIDRENRLQNIINIAKRKAGEINKNNLKKEKNKTQYQTR